MVYTKWELDLLKRHQRQSFVKYINWFHANLKQLDSC